MMFMRSHWTASDCRPLLARAASAWIAFLVVLFFATSLLGEQVAPSKSILGTVTSIQAASGEMELKPDDSNPIPVRFGPDTEVLQVKPGELDLTKATPAKATDMRAGDRVLVSYVTGMTEARRILVMSAADITKRNDSAELAWETSSIFGVVTSTGGNQLTLRVATPQGQKSAIVTITDKTIFRRYAPDSIKFVDAVPANLSDIATGDQLRARGAKSDDGLAMTAEEIVFGSFQTHLGPITAVNRQGREITIRDLTTKKLLTVAVTPDSKLKMLPDLGETESDRAGNTGGAGAGDSSASAKTQPGRLDMTQMLEHLPPAKFGDLKTGEAIVVTSTQGTTPGRVNAIMLIANAGFVVQMVEAVTQPGGQNSARLAAIMAAHGNSGMIGPGGLNLPAMIP